MAGDQTSGWQSLSEARERPPDVAPRTALPAGTPWPVGALIVLACLVCGLSVQHRVAWPPWVSSGSGPGVPNALLILVSEQLGTLFAGGLEPRSVPGALLLQPSQFAAWISGFALLFLAPLAEVLRGRAVWLEAWGLTFLLAQGGQQLAPFASPGDAAPLLPLLVGVALTGTIRLPPDALARSNIRALAVLGALVGGFLGLVQLASGPALALVSFSVGLGLGAVPRIRGPWAVGAAGLGLGLWLAGVPPLVARSAEPLRQPASCTEVPAEQPPPRQPRAAYLEAQWQMEPGCWEGAVQRLTGLAERWPSARRIRSWDNNLAWATALAWPDDPERLTGAKRLAQSAVQTEGSEYTRHTLATIQLLLGDAASAAPEVHWLNEGAADPEDIALLCLLSVVREDLDAAVEPCEAFFRLPGARRNDLRPVLEDRLATAGLELEALAPPED